MKIIVAIVHYWNPDGGGTHQSLRPNPQPRIQALSSQILSLRRLSLNQSVLHMQDRSVYRVNDEFRHSIDILLVHDGTHHVLDHLSKPIRDSVHEVIVSPSSPLYLGFEAHKVLSGYIDSDYDMYGYLEDDLLIHDCTFFSKIYHFTELLGSSSLLLPQRYEVSPVPHRVDRFYIDGPLESTELRKIIPNPGPIRLINALGFTVPFSQPLNPHSGCFFLTHNQFKTWTSSNCWLDRDCSFVSPLESAATLGISKVFELFKPCFSHAGWLDIQHYGTSFHSLISDISS